MVRENGDILVGRVSSFENFRKERLPVLHKFAEILGFSDPHVILLNPENFVSGVSDYFETRIVEGDDKVWLLTRVGYFVGELLVCKYDGCWFVDEDSASSTFARYVVGDFSDHPNKIVDPFELAKVYVDTPAPRSLKKQLESFFLTF